MKTYKETVGDLSFYVRSDSDLEVCKEVVERKCYERKRLGFGIRENETWLDCGANIGAFAVWAETRFHAKVIGYEACEENTILATANLELNQCRSTVTTAFISGRTGGKTSVNFNERTPARSSPTCKGMQRYVSNVSLAEEIDRLKPDGLKIDIEGGEFELLDSGIPLDGIRAVALEYHFRFDKSCVKARKRIGPLIEYFPNHSIPKTIFSEDAWPAWQDAILLFWK
jgi:FkbM family methyltransferase